MASPGSAKGAKYDIQITAKWREPSEAWIRENRAKGTPINEDDAHHWVNRSTKVTVLEGQTLPNTDSISTISNQGEVEDTFVQARASIAAQGNGLMQRVSDKLRLEGKLHTGGRDLRLLTQGNQNLKIRYADGEALRGSMTTVRNVNGWLDQRGLSDSLKPNASFLRLNAAIGHVITDQSLDEKGHYKITYEFNKHVSVPEGTTIEASGAVVVRTEIEGNKLIITLKPDDGAKKFQVLRFRHSPSGASFGVSSLDGLFRIH